VTLTIGVRIAISLLAIGLPTACATDLPATGFSEQALFCPEQGCGDNSPLMDGIPIAEGSEDPDDANDAGVRILGMMKGGKSYEVLVRGWHLIGHDPSGVDSLENHELVGSVIVAHHEGTDQDYYIHIVDWRAILRFWVDDDGGRIPTYRLEWTDNPAVSCTKFHDNDCPNVCPLVADHDTYGEAKVEAAFFEGDLYDRVNRTVTAIGDDAGKLLFNVACAGSAPLKMLAYRFTSVSSTDKFVSDQGERTTMLKVFGADYCGTGKAFTAIGTKIRWQSADDRMLLDEPLPLPIDEESVWTEKGALCLDVPRLGDTKALTWEVWEAIEEECPEKKLRRCSALSWFPDDWKSHGYVRTANPPP
jgi:ADYC domain